MIPNICYLIAIIGMILYWVGGEAWAHTLFRDIGCSLAAVIVATILFHWSWWFLAAFAIIWAGMTLGDYGKFQWSVHGFVISLGFAPYAIAQHLYWPLAFEILTVTGLTYITSRYLSNKLGLDVWCRGILYITTPFWFLIK